MTEQIVGKCSKCGGDVKMSSVCDDDGFWGYRCLRCGAYKNDERKELPTIEME